MREFRPSPGITDVLRGTFSEPIQVRVPKDGTPKLTRLSIEGSGQWGITDLQLNKERAGINHHSILTARYALYLADRLHTARNERRITFDDKFAPDPQRIGDTMIVSHAGRWAWENARDYPEETAHLLGAEKTDKRRTI